MYRNEWLDVVGRIPPGMLGRMCGDVELVVERTWRIIGTWVELRLVLVPICASTGSIVFVQAYGHPYARGVLDGWMESFRWTNGRNLTACDFLDPTQGSTDPGQVTPLWINVSEANEFPQTVRRAGQGCSRNSAW